MIVEIVGGPRDGEKMAVQDGVRSIKIPFCVGLAPDGPCGPGPIEYVYREYDVRDGRLHWYQPVNGW